MAIWLSQVDAGPSPKIIPRQQTSSTSAVPTGVWVFPIPPPPRSSTSKATPPGPTTTGISQSAAPASPLPPPVSPNDGGNGTCNGTAPCPSVVPAERGLSAGPVAGIAIGSAVLGLVLGLIVAFCLLKRRNRREPSNHDQRRRTWSTGHFEPMSHAKPMGSAEPKGFVSATAASYESGGSGIQLAHFLLDATPDGEMAAEVHSLGQLIQQHVESAYHTQRVQVERHELAQAAANLGLGQGSGSSLGADDVASLALDPRTRHLALQHVLSFVLFTSIDFGARSRLSMLPSPIAAFLQSVPPPERGQANGEAAALGLSRWRALSAFLLHPMRSDRTTLQPSEAATMPQSARLAAAMDTFLGAFVPADEQSRLDQKEHLESVAAEVARLGYVLLSQPCDVRFVHDAGRQPTDGMLAVVCAGLEKVTAKDGTPLDAPRVVLAPTLARVHK